MPILAGSGQVLIPDAPTQVALQPVARSAAVGSITATWIDPVGREWALSDTSEELGWFTTPGPAGWGSTPIELVTDPLPRGGEQIRFIRSKPRRMQWPIYIGGRDHQEYTARRRAITRAFTMTTQRMAPGYLKVARRDGDARLIACYFEQGLEGEAGQDWLSSRNAVQLYCPDGYWSASQPITMERTFTPQNTPFINPFMTVTSSRVLSGGEGDPPTVVNNVGDVEAWPMWTLTGPMTKFTAENQTIGSRFALTYGLAAGQQVTITTNPPTVRGPGNANFARYIDWFNPDGTELWPLLDGSNDIRFAVDGAGAGTKVQLSFTPRYETA